MAEVSIFFRNAELMACDSTVEGVLGEEEASGVTSLPASCAAAAAFAAARFLRGVKESIRLIVRPPDETPPVEELRAIGWQCTGGSCCAWVRESLAER